jgi:hypothetical protein
MATVRVVLVASLCCGLALAACGSAGSGGTGGGAQTSAAPSSAAPAGGATKSPQASSNPYTDTGY